jgi:hypothetical protein
MDEPDFRAGTLSTAYIEEHGDLLDPSPGEDELIAAALGAALLEDEHRHRHQAPRIGRLGAGEPAGGLSAWRSSGWPWESAG